MVEIFLSFRHTAFDNSILTQFVITKLLLCDDKLCNNATVKSSMMKTQYIYICFSTSAYM